MMKYLPFLLCAVFLGGCATVDKPRISAALQEVTGQNGRACFRTDEIKGYGVREHAVINIDALRQYYVATVRPGCHDLNTSAAAMFAGDFFEVCGGRMDQLLTGAERCTIEHIFRFDDRSEAFRAFDEAQQWRDQQVREQ